MTLRKKHSALAILLVLLFAGAPNVHAEPRGTPTIVTNDSTSPVVVLGTVSATNSYFYKPIGVTTAKVSKSKSNYARSVACAKEFTNSRICTSEEMIYFPGIVNIEASPATILPIIVSNITYNSPSGNLDISGKSVKYNGNGNWLLFVLNNDITNSDGAVSEHSVVCCAPQ